MSGQWKSDENFDIGFQNCIILEFVQCVVCLKFFKICYYRWLTWTPPGAAPLDPCRRSASRCKVRDFPLWMPRDWTFLKVNCVAKYDGVHRNLADRGEQWQSLPEKFKFGELCLSMAVCHNLSWSANIRRTSPQSARVLPYSGLRLTVEDLNCPLESVKVKNLTRQIIRQIIVFEVAWARHSSQTILMKLADVMYD